MVKIIYRDEKKVVFFGSKGRETVILRKARKRHLCHQQLRDGILIQRHFIEPGEYYYEDHINYTQRRRYGVGYIKHHIIKICTKCWKGPRPKQVIKNERL